ncbi:MAG: hypothetical protein K8R18_16985 [Parvibaculum sp.]|uniref:hypothetical protein n=1 Tax=Parvibaculum sp. TaxID=2024848 RepID=UPI0025FEC1AB|nr:hypothetical protein [Parvibaculum sp.]MCE9651318.1 hypothetical protein [Parvibaculum sp.]
MRGWFIAMLALCAGVSVAFADEAELPPEQRMAPVVMSPVVSGGESLDAAAVPAPPGYRWKITKLAWSASDERAYGEFVHAIGMSDCRNADECLKSAANIYRASDPAGMSFFADCADLPYLLRAYFAWKNGLPFSYASGVAAVGNSNDLRYSRYGNYVYARTDVRPPTDGMWPNARTVLWNLNNNISSAMYRFAPGPTRGEPFDFYPVRIAPGSIRPGTVIYDPNGHVAVVYDVDDEGRIRFIDSHPDNSVTRGNYGRRFVRSSAPMGAGFKNWRPLTLTGATQGADGSYVGGVVVPTPDAQLPDWSDEQFFGTVRGAGWQSGRFVYNGETVDYYDYVRRAVAGHDIVYDPVVETRSMVKGLCDDLHYRAEAVDIAVKAGLNQQPQPSRLPENIYGTSGDWETYSTPSRDARLKVSFKELRDQVVKFLEMSRAGDKGIAYAGTDLPGDLAAAYREEAGQCPVTYQASDGSTRTMSFEDARARLFDFSFDPYQCPERRWGATAAEELATCPDGELKRRWYEAERRLRNQTDRTYDARMDFSLADLQAAKAGSGRDAPPDVDTLAALSGLRGSATNFAAAPEGGTPILETIPERKAQ